MRSGKFNDDMIRVINRDNVSCGSQSKQSHRGNLSLTHVKLYVKLQRQTKGIRENDELPHHSHI